MSNSPKLGTMDKDQLRRYLIAQVEEMLALPCSDEQTASPKAKKRLAELQKKLDRLKLDKSGTIQ